MIKIYNIFFALLLILTPLCLDSFESDHEKAIEAVKDGQILPLDQILASLNNKYQGRVLAINLKDSEKGLFGWVYDIRMIDKSNKIINLRVDAGTSTILFTETGD